MMGAQTPFSTMQKRIPKFKYMDRSTEFMWATCILKLRYLLPSVCSEIAQVHLLRPVAAVTLKT